MPHHALPPAPPPEPLAAVLADLRACRLCRDAPARGPALPHEPRPIIQASATARLCIASQAPGIRAHRQGRPFMDPSGVRLRHWLGLDEATFYDERLIAIVPMGHCFPGHDQHGGDLPPRPECAPTWRDRIFAALPQLHLVLLIGHHAQRWHLEAQATSMTETVAAWETILASHQTPRLLPLPHPSWRNNRWLDAHPWFERTLLPRLRSEVTQLLR